MFLYLDYFMISVKKVKKFSIFNPNEKERVLKKTSIKKERPKNSEKPKLQKSNKVQYVPKARETNVPNYQFR